MTGRSMAAWQLDFSLRGLYAAVIETVRNPRAVAERLLDMNLPMPVIWTMLAAVSAVSVVLVEGSLLLVQVPGEEAEARLPSPFLIFGLQIVLSTLLASVTHLGDTPRVEQLVGVIKVMLDAYNAGQVDKVFLSYNDFVNTMTQKATFDQLLPLPAAETQVARHDWDYLYEPDAESVLAHVLTRYIESLVYQAVMENVASEHAARMVAMKAASDNATKLIGTLNLVYNKARQAAITQEISEIVGGAAAV